MDYLLMLSIVLEAAIMVMCLAAAFSKGRKYMVGFGVTFAIYVFYDAARLVAYPVAQIGLQVIFLVATLSALWSAWQIYTLESKQPAAKGRKKR